MKCDDRNNALNGSLNLWKHYLRLNEPPYDYECVLIEYHQCNFTLQISHKLRYCHMRRYLYKHMYVIRTALCFYNIDVSILTQLSQYLTYIHF